MQKQVQSPAIRGPFTPAMATEWPKHETVLAPAYTIPAVRETLRVHPPQKSDRYQRCGHAELQELGRCRLAA